MIELANALQERAPERMGAYLLNPDLALPAGIEALVASAKLRFVDEAEYPDGATLHLASPFELSIPLDRLLPPAAIAARLHLVVTLFDLIPEAMDDVYLADPGLRRRYRARRELVRQADHVLAISDHVAGEASRLLGVSPRRLTTVGLAPAAAFRPRPPAAGDGPAAGLAGVPGLDPEYVLYTGGSDGRKNVEGLLEAWALLSEGVRARWQLVLGGHLPPLQRNHFEVMADRLGFGDRLLVTGWLPEPALVALTQGAALLVFPSLAEGYGLPVAEAMACATPAIASDRTSLPELLPPEALFDPTDRAAMAGAVARALTDDGHRSRLLAWAARPRRTWDDVAAETLSAYDALAAGAPARVIPPATPATPATPAPPALDAARVISTPPPPAAPGAVRPAPAPSSSFASTSDAGRFRLAFTTPLPPQPGGVSDYSWRLLEELRHLAAVEVFVDGPPHHRGALRAPSAPEGVIVRPLAAMARAESLTGRYDAVVYSLGNSEFHTGSLARLQRRPGVVLAHDVRLTTLYAFAHWQHPDAVPGGFHQTLQRMYAGRLPADLGAAGALDPGEADRWGVLMARDAIAASTRFLATSAFAAELARLDARPEHRRRVGVLPFSVGAVPVEDPTPAADRPGPPIVAAFGVVNGRKQATVVTEAFATAVAAATGTWPGARIVFVGPAGDADRQAVLERAHELGLDGRVEVTGAVDAAAYRGWLDRAWVAVQLRASTNGESSGAVGDCLTAGLPTIVTAIGPNRALPADAVVTVPSGAGGDEIGRVLASLLASPERRRLLGLEARRYAAAHTFGRAAEALYAVVSGGG